MEWISHDDPVRLVMPHWQFPQTVRQIETLGNAGGFSGSKLWRIVAGPTCYCLRRWPRQHPTSTQLDWIHRVLQHVVAAGCSFVPLPLACRDHATWAQAAGHLWELTPWMPGQASFHRHPSPRRLESAMDCLARWHLAAGNLGTPGVGQSPGLIRRCEQLSSLAETELDRLHRSVDGRRGASIARDSADILRCLPVLLEPSRRRLAEASRVSLRLQPCIRDIWHDHVLYTGESVSGIVDFGAMSVDTVVGDLARLLGSLMADDRDGWRRGIEAYQRRVPLEAYELQLLAAFDRANGILGGLNWIRWLFLEDRRFENLTGVAERISNIRARLRCWVDGGAH